MNWMARELVPSIQPVGVEHHTDISEQWNTFFLVTVLFYAYNNHFMMNAFGLCVFFLGDFQLVFFLIRISLLTWSLSSGARKEKGPFYQCHHRRWKENRIASFLAIFYLISFTLVFGVHAPHILIGSIMESKWNVHGGICFLWFFLPVIFFIIWWNWFAFAFQIIIQRFDGIISFLNHFFPTPLTTLLCVCVCFCFTKIIT